MADERVEKARAALDRIQKFDTSTLPREDVLGQQYTFREAVAPAQRIIELFQQFPIDLLSYLPDNQLNTISNNAESMFQILGQILAFDSTQQNGFNQRNQLIQNLKSQYQPLFDQLNPIISYGASRQRDFGAIEREFRASIQRTQDDAEKLTNELMEKGDEAQRILDEVRRVAAEQGVSQQARYFQEESAIHGVQAAKWRKWTVWTAAGLAFYAAASAFLPDLPGLVPANNYEAVELSVSKVLVFAVIAYVVLLCGRNFLSHTHNQIVNRHRQNALLTFNALADAAGTAERRDIVLTYAAACIFAPQDTGYTKGAGNIAPDVPPSIIQALPRLVAGTHG